MYRFYYKYFPIYLEILILEKQSSFFIYKINFISKPKKARIDKNNQLIKFINKINDYFDAYFYDKKAISPPKYEVYGTPFQKNIWNTLTKIPFGSTVSYKELGILSGYNSNYSRAVGNACNRNPIPIVVPCHRVVGKNHQLFGFSGGIEIKKWLLEHEGCKI